MCYTSKQTSVKTGSQYDTFSLSNVFMIKSIIGSMLISCPFFPLSVKIQQFNSRASFLTH